MRKLVNEIRTDILDVLHKHQEVVDVEKVAFDELVADLLVVALTAIVDVYMVQGISKGWIQKHFDWGGDK